MDKDIIRNIKEVARTTLPEISPHIYTKSQWESWSYTPFYKNVERDKIVLV